MTERPTGPSKRFQNERIYSSQYVDTTAYAYYEGKRRVPARPSRPLAPFASEGLSWGVKVGVRVFFGGAKRAPTSAAVSGPVRARVRLRRRLRGVFRGPPERGGGGRTRPRLPPLSSLPWGGGAKRAPKVRPDFATVGRSTDCTGGAFEHRKGSYPLSHVSYSRRRTGTSPLPDPPAAAAVWVPRTGHQCLRKPRVAYR